MDRHQVLRLTSITMLLTVLFVGSFSILQALLMMVIGSLGSGTNLVYLTSIGLELVLFVSLVVLLGLYINRSVPEGLKAALKNPAAGFMAGLLAAAEALFMLAKVLPTDYRIMLAMVTQRENGMSAVNLLTGILFILQIIFGIIYARRSLRAMV